MKNLIFIALLLTVMMVSCNITKTIKINDCENFSEQDQIDECYLKHSENIIYCENIKQSAMRDLCYYNFAINDTDLNLCRKMNSTNPFYCYKKIADLTNNASICYDIEDAGWKDLCLKSYGEMNSNFTVCNDINDFNFKNDCLINVSQALNDESICEHIELSYRCNEGVKLNCVKIRTYQDQCYTPIALNKKDIKICNMIEDLIFRSQCIKALAVQEKDISICKMIEFSPIKEKCLEKAWMEMLLT